MTEDAVAPVEPLFTEVPSRENDFAQAPELSSVSSAPSQAGPLPAEPLPAEPLPAEPSLEPDSVYDAPEAIEKAAGAEVSKAAESTERRPFVTLLVLLFVVAAAALAYTYREDLNQGIRYMLDSVAAAPTVAPVAHGGSVVDAGEQQQVEGVKVSAPKAQASTPKKVVEIQLASVQRVFRVRFEYGSATLGVQARQVLDDALLSVRVLSNSAAYITGYADSAEAQRAQEGLSLRRAIAVARFLMLQGVERNRLQVAVFNVADEPVEATLTAPQPTLWGAVEVRIDEPHYPG